MQSPHGTWIPGRSLTADNHARPLETTWFTMSAAGQAIVALRLARHSRDKFRSLYDHIHGLPEVLQVLHVSGVNDLLLHVAVRDVIHLRDLVVDEIATRSEVANCETSVIFSSFRNSRLPVYTK